MSCRGSKPLGIVPVDDSSRQAADSASCVFRGFSQLDTGFVLWVTGFGGIRFGASICGVLVRSVEYRVLH
jgi:hypothetical protein